MPLIMPIKDLRNTTEISNIAHKEQEPIFITKNGILKKSLLTEYNLKRNSGATAIKLDEGDSASARIFFQKALEVCEKQLAKAPTAYDSVQKACYLMMMDEDEKAKAAFQEIPSFKQAFGDEEYDESKKEIGNTIESWRNAYRTHKEIFGK